MKILRRVYGVVLVLGLTLFLFGCQEDKDVSEDDWDEDSNPIQKEDKELVIRHMFSTHFEEDYNGIKLREIYDRIEEEHGYTVQSESQTHEGYTAILADDLSRGELPHIMEFHVTLEEEVNFIHEHKDNLLDLTDFLEESGLMEEFYSLDRFTVDERVYGLPAYSGGMMHLYYNKKLVEELGGVPETFEEFLAMMKEAKQAGYNPIIMDEEGDYNPLSIMPYYLFQGILLETAGREKLDALMNGEAKWSDNEFVEAFQFMEEIAKIEIPKYDMFQDGLYNEFLSGNTVFMYFNFAPEDDDAFGVMPFPAVSKTKENSGIMMGTFPFGFVFNGDVSEDEEKMIYQFIETFWSEKIMSEFYLDDYLVPAIRVEAETDNTLFNETIAKLNASSDIIPEIAGLVPDVKGFFSEFGTEQSSTG